MVSEIIENAADILSEEGIQKSKHGIEKIKIGEGIEFSPEDANKIRSSAWYTAKRYGRKYITRRLKNGNFLLMRTA